MNDMEKMRNKNNDKNCFSIYVLAYLLLMPLIIDLFNVIINQFHLGSASTMTLFIYVASLLIILLKGYIYISINDVFLWGASIIPFILSYLLFDDSKLFLFEQDMLIIYVFFLPLSILYVKNIDNWDCFYDIFEKFAIIAVAIAICILLFFDYSRYLVYMGFSYALLPFISVLYHQARKNFSIKKWLFFVLGLISILIFGARATLLFFIIYIFSYEFSYDNLSKGRSILKILFLIIVCSIIILEYDVIILKISHIQSFSNSYIIQRLVRGKLFEAETRNVLYESCRNRLQNMKLEVSGFFGDRRYCAGFAYPHNIVYEIIMSWGWILGSIFLFVLFACILKVGFAKEKNLRKIAWLFIITCFLRYFVSGSYLIEGRFWIFIFILYSLLKNSKRKQINQIKTL